MTPTSPTVAGCPTLQISSELGIRLLALVVGPEGEAYRVSVRSSSVGPFVAGVLTHAAGDQWDLGEQGRGTTRVTWASPDAVFALALGRDPAADPSVVEAAPHWPEAVVDRLVRRRLAGPGTVAFDVGWFLAELATSAFDRPILLPDAASKLGLVGLERAAALLGAASGSLASLLVRALDGEPPDGSWGGEGRLIAEFTSGELAQLGTDVDEGCRAALGTGPLHVVFAPLEPLGLGLGPLLPSEDVGVEYVASDGLGCAVGEVDSGGAAERAGVTPGMSLSHLSNPFLDLSLRGSGALSFEEVLEAIDARRSLGGPLAITFDTAASVTHLYAVEMPAAEALSAIAGTVEGGPRLDPRDVGVGAPLDDLCGRTLVWREDTPRLFLGEAGSVSSAHTDMCPQVQMAHALLGTKLLGVASHAATPRLRAEHAPDGQDEDGVEHQATRVPTDQPLTPRASGLLCDADMTLAALLPGDLAVFDSGALHFASNGAEGLCGAVYHGMITPGAVPRLRLAAAAHAGSEPSMEDAYGDHLFAPELLRLVESALLPDS